MATIIRQKGVVNGFIVVVTDVETGFTARYQEYSTHAGGKTVLEFQHSFSSEEEAIKLFDASPLNVQPNNHSGELL